jgi:RNA-directed DNA polymerase
MDRVRARVKDKRVLALVKAFCKAGILTELGQHKNTNTGTPQGAILSPLLATSPCRRSMSTCTGHGRAMSTPSDVGLGLRQPKTQRGEHTGDVVVQGLDVVAGAVHEHDEVVRVADDPPVRQALGAASGASAHMSEAFEFLGFRIQ